MSFSCIHRSIIKNDTYTFGRCPWHKNYLRIMAQKGLKPTGPPSEPGETFSKSIEPMYENLTFQLVEDPLVARLSKIPKLVMGYGPRKPAY